MMVLTFLIFIGLWRAQKYDYWKNVGISAILIFISNILFTAKTGIISNILGEELWFLSFLSAVTISWIIPIYLLKKSYHPPKKVLNEATVAENSSGGFMKTEDETIEEDYTYNVGSTDWPEEIRLNKAQNTFTYFSRSPDWLFSSNRLYEIKFDESTLFAKLIEERSEHAGEEALYSVRDNVVLESVIRKEVETNKFMASSLDERLKTLKSLTNWHLINNKDIEYYIMSKYSEFVSPTNFRRELRQELERLDNGVARMIKDLEKLGAAVEKSEYDGYKISFKDGDSEENKKNIDAYFKNKEFEKYKIMDNDFFQYFYQKRILSKWLGEKEAA